MLFLSPTKVNKPGSKLKSNLETGRRLASWQNEQVLSSAVAL